MFKLLVLCLFMLSGCTIGDDYVAPEAYKDKVIASELKTGSANELPKNWYEKLNDEQLNKLIKTGLQNSPDIEVAIAKLRQARAQLKIDETNALPFVNVNAAWNYEKAGKNVKLSSDSHYYNAGFDASWEIDIWGKNRRQTEADTALVKSMEYSLSDVQIILEAEIVSAYVNLMKNIKLLQTAQENERLQKQIFSAVKNKYDSGLTDDTALNQAEYLLLTTQAAIPQYRSNIEKYTNSLSVLSGILPSLMSLQHKSSLFEKNLALKAEDAYKLPVWVVRLRPDVAASEQRLVAQNALVAKAVAELYPSLSLSAVWGVAAQSGSKLFNSSSNTYNYSPLVSLPLLDWDKLQNNIELQKGIFAENLGDYRKTVLSAVAEIKTAATAWKNAETTLRKKRYAVSKINKAVQNLQHKYDSGLIPFSELLSMRQNLIESQNEKIEAQADEFLQFAAFYKAIGAK